jgi:hypothetical protein
MLSNKGRISFMLDAIKKNKVCCVIIDNGSCANVASITLVKSWTWLLLSVLYCISLNDWTNMEQLGWLNKF